MQFHLDDMHCGGCARSVEAAIRALDPQAQIQTRPEERLLELQSSLPRERVEQALRAAGFPPRVE